MKTIYLHIGPHKTGTTTIQQSLNINQDLLFRHGVFIPKAGQVFPSQAGHHNLAWELITDDRFNNVYGTWKDLLNEINDAKADEIIISAEGFSYVPQEKTQLIKKYLQDYAVYIVIYLRRQDYRLQSIWTQSLKKVEIEEFYEDFRDWLERNHYEVQNCNYLELLRKWSGVFGKENIIVRVLEKDQLQGTLFQDFLSACEIENPGNYAISQDMNLSPGIRDLVIIKEFKKRLLGKLDEGSRIRFYSSLLDYAEIEGWNNQKWSIVDQEIYNKVSEHYKLSNQQVAREYFNRDELFLEKFIEKGLTSFSIKDFQPEELMDLFAYVTSNMFNAKQRKELVEENVLLRKEIEAIYASKGWRLLQKFRSVRNSARSFIKKG